MKLDKNKKAVDPNRPQLRRAPDADEDNRPTLKRHLANSDHF
jgi:hypothetical protein